MPLWNLVQQAETGAPTTTREEELTLNNQPALLTTMSLGSLWTANTSPKMAVATATTAAIEKATRKTLVGIAPISPLRGFPHTDDNKNTNTNKNGGLSEEQQLDDDKAGKVSFLAASTKTPNEVTRNEKTLTEFRTKRESL